MVSVVYGSFIRNVKDLINEQLRKTMDKKKLKTFLIYTIPQGGYLYVKCGLYYCLQLNYFPCAFDFDTTDKHPMKKFFTDLYHFHYYGYRYGFVNFILFLNKETF